MDFIMFYDSLVILKAPFLYLGKFSDILENILR